MKDSFRIVLIGLVSLSVAHPWQLSLADSSDDYDANGTKKTYYWEGNQINNLNRLGSTDFEGVERRSQTGKGLDEYLTAIREKMAHQSQADAKEKTTLAFQGQGPGGAIELTYLSPGVRVTLHADALFDENTAMMKLGAMDTLQRLRTLLETQAQRPLQFVIADTMDDVAQSRDLDAERSLVVLNIMEGSETNSGVESLAPEILTR